MSLTNDINWCFSDRASWIDYILITNLLHWLLFIHKILFSSTCFKPQVLIFRRIHCIHAAYGTVTLYESSWWPVGTQLEWTGHLHGITAIRSNCRNIPTTLWRYEHKASLRHQEKKEFSLKLCTDRPPGTFIEGDSTICCMCTTVSSWRWALEARNM